MSDISKRRTFIGRLKPVLWWSPCQRLLVLLVSQFRGRMFYRNTVIIFNKTDHPHFRIWFTNQGIMTVKFQIEFLTNFWGKGVLYKLYTHRATCRNREFVWVWRSLARVSVKILQWCYVKSKKIFQSKIFDN